MSCPTGIPDWSNATLATFNVTLLLDSRLCTACTCPLELEGHMLGMMSYFPSLGGNAFFAALFGVCLLIQLGLGIRHKTWGFLISMTGGLVLEIIGYVARVLMRDNMFTDSYFIMYLVCLTLGPAFLAAAIYLSLSRLITIYSPSAARFRPQIYTYIFIGCDLVALILQAAGGAIASISDPGSDAQTAGVNTMVAGVAWQVFALALFGVLAVEFWVRAKKVAKAGGLNPDFEGLRQRKAFQPFFIAALALAGVFIFVRSVFRCAELSGGFDGPLANEEVTFMVLEGTMIALACVLLTASHPGLAVGTEAWAAASWKGKKNRRAGDEEKFVSASSSGPETE